MAVVILGVVGNALGAGIGMAAIGGAVGAYVGGLVDQALLGPKGINAPHPGTPQVQSSAYGKDIPLVFGINRIAGNVIWLGNVRVSPIKQKSSPFGSSSTVGYDVSIDIAIGLAGIGSLETTTLTSSGAVEDDVLSVNVREGLIGFRRIWFDNELVYDARTINNKIIDHVDFSADNIEFYDGSETQEPNGHMEVFEGAGNVPAYRGLSYLVLHDVYTPNFGNHVPNVTVEVLAGMPKIYAQEGLSGLAEDNNGDIWIASHTRRTLTQVDPVTLKVKTIVGETDDYLGSLKAHPTKIAIADHGDIVFTCYGDSSVQRIDIDTLEVDATLAVDYYPYGIVTDNDGFMWITHPTRNKLTKIDPGDMTLVDTYDLDYSPWDIAKASDNDDLWITTDSDLVRWSIDTNTIVDRIAVGINPWGVAQNPVNPREIWCSVSAEDCLAVINKEDNSILSYVNAGTMPRDMSSHPADTTYGGVAVTTYYGNRLSVYNSYNDTDYFGGVITVSEHYTRLINDGTVSFPGDCLFLLDGRIIVTQVKYDFCLVSITR